MEPLPRSFFDRNALKVAPALLGCVLARRMAEGWILGRIVETEAYVGEHDLACHARAGRTALPAGLTAREAEVLRLLALGSTTRQVADRLEISAKTADHHVQHIYTKLGVSTRGAAALFAIEHGILATDR